ncbi:hypothetical protein pipiens_000341, partial [Culex pipiens pipiens]
MVKLGVIKKQEEPTPVVQLSEITAVVLKRLQLSEITAVGFKQLNKDKCQFGARSVKFVGHIVSAEGLKPDDEMLEAIRRIKVPDNKKQFQRLLGMVTYLSKFFTNLSQVTAPLRQLLQKDVAWRWETDQQHAFESIKELLSTLPVLKFYDVNKENRIILDVQPYAPDVVYVKGVDVPIADALSRDVDNPAKKNDDELEVHIVMNVTRSWMNRIVTETDKEEVFKKLMQVINEEWPEVITQLDPEIQPFWNFRDELSTYAGVVYKGERILIPYSLRQTVLKEIHAGHFSIQSCIRRAKQLVFWPGMSRDIQQFVDECGPCQKFSRSNVKEPRIPEYPFQIVASDIFHFKGAIYLVLVDSYSG